MNKVDNVDIRQCLFSMDIWLTMALAFCLSEAAIGGLETDCC